MHALYSLPCSKIRVKASFLLILPKYFVPAEKGRTLKPAGDGADEGVLCLSIY